MGVKAVGARVVVPIRTAVGGFYYDDVVKGAYTLDGLVRAIFANYCEKHKWNYWSFKRGSFGYDTIAFCVMYIIQNHNGNRDIEHLAELSHEAWSVIYKHWRDAKPFITGGYMKPRNISTNRNNRLATTCYGELTEDEKMIEREIPKFLLYNNII